MFKATPLDLIPAPVYAFVILGLLVMCGALGLQNAHLKVDVAEKQSEVHQWESALSKRVAAEKTAVAEAVQKARAEEQKAARDQQRKVYELQQANATAALELASARERMRDPIDRAAAACTGGEHVPGATADAGGAENEAAARFKQAGRRLTDGILQLTAEADKAIRERNLCTELLPRPD